MGTDCGEAGAVIEDSGPGAYVDTALLDEADTEIPEVAPDAYDAAETVEEAEVVEEGEDWGEMGRSPYLALEEISTQEAGFAHAEAGSEDDALPDEEVQAMLLKDAGLTRDTALNASLSEHVGDAMSEKAMADEDDVFLDTIYEG